MPTPDAAAAEARVTTVTPMKRGLKAPAWIAATVFFECYNRYPDEKGTERCLFWLCWKITQSLQPLPR